MFSGIPAPGYSYLTITFRDHSTFPRRTKQATPGVIDMRIMRTIPPELEPEPGLNPPLNIVNPMFGFCQGTACSICPDKTTEKIGNYDACFPE